MTLLFDVIVATGIVGLFFLAAFCCYLWSTSKDDLPGDYVMNRDFSFWFYGTLLIAGFVSCVAYVAMSLV